MFVLNCEPPLFLISGTDARDKGLTGLFYCLQGIYLTGKIE